MRSRREVRLGVIAGGGAAITLLVGLVTNAVSETEQWPSWLGWLQDHPWLSFVILGAVMVGFAALLAALGDSDDSSGTAIAGNAGGESLVQPEAASRHPGAALVLRSLPRDTGAFTNRTAELDRLIRAVETALQAAEPLPVHVIDGMPGVGKTAFAVHVGYALAQRFPDGQLFVNLNGHTPGRSPVQPSEALASLLAATGVPTQQIPVGDDVGAVTEARAALWRGQLADRKVLLILDNAASYRQFEPLLPGGGACLVLVTSRRRLAAHEEVLVSVEALPASYAVDLFTRLSGRPEESLDQAVSSELVRLCGHLPLGVSLLAARLRNHPTWEVEDLRDRLTQTRDRLGELRAGERAVDATFELSYRDLPADRARFFRNLGLFPGTDIDAYVAAALDTISVTQARRHLDALYDDHLIDEHPGNRYRLHDLLRDYARALADEGEGMDQVQAVERVGGYYLAALASANGHLARRNASNDTPSQRDAAGGQPADLPTLDTRTRALGWLEDERANVLACIERASNLSLDNTVIQLAAAMAPFLRQAGPWDQAVGVHRIAADSARNTGDRQSRADALAELGVVRRFMANYPQAAQALTDAVDLYDDVGDRRGKAEALNQLGIVWYLTADNDEAAQAQSEALEICRESGDKLGQANALADLGMVRRQTSQFDAAAEAQGEALTIYRELADSYGEANALRDLGQVHCLMGRYEQAAGLQQEAYDIYCRLGDRVHQAYALNELAAVRRLTGDYTAALEGHTQALDTFTELGDRFGKANSIRHLGALDRLTGDYPGSLQRLEEALDLYRDLGSRGGEAATLSELGLTHGLLGRLAVATDAFEQGLSILRALGDRCSEAELLNHWGNLQLVAGQQDGGRRHFHQALVLARDVDCPLEAARALEGIGRRARQDEGREAAAEPLLEAQEIYQRLGLSTPAEELEQLLRS